MIRFRLSISKLAVAASLSAAAISGCDQSSQQAGSPSASSSSAQVESSSSSGGATGLTGSEQEIANHVGRALSDMRSMATALESYYVDCNAYPAWTDQPGELQLPRTGGAKAIPSFMAKTDKHQAMTLTTPIAYMTSLFTDPFSGQPASTFVYYAATVGEKKGWIIVSAGPDGRYDLDTKLYDPALSAADATNVLAPFTFDPTNGVMSAGDIWRIKQ
jgi:hypothetical protein